MQCVKCRKDFPRWMRHCPNCHALQPYLSATQMFGIVIRTDIFMELLLRKPDSSIHTAPPPHTPTMTRTSVVALGVVSCAVIFIISTSLIFFNVTPPQSSPESHVTSKGIVVLATATGLPLTVTPTIKSIVTATSGSASQPTVKPVNSKSGVKPTPVTLPPTATPMTLGATPTVAINVTSTPASDFPAPTVIVVDSASILTYVSCIIQNSDNTFTAYWGYSNTTGMSQQIAVGPNNHMNPSPDDWGQATIFAIGNSVTPFHTMPAAHDMVLVWYLAWNGNGRTATASWNSPLCTMTVTNSTNNVPLSKTLHFYNHMF